MMKTLATALFVLAITGCVAGKFHRFQFKLPSTCTTGPCAWDYIYEHYANWQNDTLADPNHCTGAKVLVWSPNAGLGDSLLALVTAVVTAIKTGRLFFVDWTQPHGGWRVGLGQPSAYSGDWVGAYTFPWDWHTYACRAALEEETNAQFRTTARVSGSITANNWVLSEVPKYAQKWFERQYGEGGRAPSGRTPDAEYDDVIPRRFQIAGRVLRPSSEVLQAMGESYSILNISYVIGLQIRTGQGAVKEGNVFLSSHDERRFFDCYDSLIERAHITVDEHKVLVVTDSEDIMAQARWRFGDRLVPVWDVPVEHSFASRSKTRQGFLKSFVDLFMLSMADTAFLTNWSLFGRAALEIGLGGDEDTRFYINDSQSTSCRDNTARLYIKRSKRMTQNKKLALLIGVGTLIGGAIGFDVQERLLKRSKEDFEARVQAEVERRRTLLAQTSTNNPLARSTPADSS